MLESLFGVRPMVRANESKLEKHVSHAVARALAMIVDCL